MYYAPDDLHADNVKVPFIQTFDPQYFTEYEGKQPVFNVVTFVSAINIALKEAFLLLILTYETINGIGTWTGDANKPQHAPFLVIDSSRYIELYWDVRAKSDGTDGCFIYTTSSLWYKLQTLGYNLFSFNAPTKQDARFGIYDLQYNRVTLNEGQPNEYEAFVRKSVSTIMNLWHDVYKIILSSNTLATRDEFITTSIRNESGGENKKFPILEDFQVELGNTPDDYSRIVFYPAGPARKIDMLSDQPLYKMDFRVQILQNDLSLEQLFLQPGESMNLKLLFQKIY